MSLRLLGNDIAVIPIYDKDTTDSGLYVPEKAKQRVDQGIVKYTGPEVQRLQRGDHVFFGGYTGQKLSDDREGVLYLMQETDVFFVYEDSDERWVPESEARNFVEEVRGRAKARGNDPDDVDAICDLMLSLIEDFFYSHGVEF